MSSSPAGARGLWSDGETRALIQTWGPLHLRRVGGSLDAEEWRRVCSAVNAHRAAARLHFNRSLAQCQKKVCSLKDQYNKELAKGLPTPGWRHFVQLHAFLAGPGGPPPGFPAKLPTASVKVEEVDEEEEAKGMEEEKEEEEAAGVLVGSMPVPPKRRRSSLQDPSGGPTSMPTTTTAKEEEGVGGECPVSVGCSTAGLVTKLAAVTTEMAAVTTKLAEVFERVEMERLSVEKAKMAVEREKSLQGGGAAKVEAGNPGEMDDN